MLCGFWIALDLRWMDLFLGFLLLRRFAGRIWMLCGFGLHIQDVWMLHPSRAGARSSCLIRCQGRRRGGYWDETRSILEAQSRTEHLKKASCERGWCFSNDLHVQNMYRKLVVVPIRPSSSCRSWPPHLCSIQVCRSGTCCHGRNILGTVWW